MTLRLQQHFLVSFFEIFIAVSICCSLCGSKKLNYDRFYRGVCDLKHVECFHLPYNGFDLFEFNCF